MSSITISLSDFRRVLKSAAHPTILDVRTPGEYANVHAADAELMPLDELDPAKIARQHRAGGGAIYVICQSGARAAKATERLRANGVADAFSIEGGTEAWLKAGLPVVRGSGGPISLERQVRIGAGLLVFIGTILGVTLTKWFLAIPLFVGGGLVFAGATDICGMGMLLGRMPWNRRKS